MTAKQHLPPELSLMSIDNSRIVLSAFKKREAGDGFVVRLVNPHPEDAAGTLTFNPVVAAGIRKVFFSNLGEAGETAAKLENGSVGVQLRGGEILTLCLEL